MDINQVKDLIHTVEESGFQEAEIIMEGVTLRLKKNGQPVPRTPVAIERATDGLPVSEAIDKQEGELVKSPLVGTFYGSPSPEAPAFVSEGTNVKKGKTLCIVEAMKVMNEITSPYSGTVKEVYVKNGDMVEYGQPLFRIV